MNGANNFNPVVDFDIASGDYLRTDSVDLGQETSFFYVRNVDDRTNNTLLSHRFDFQSKANGIPSIY